VEIFGGRISEIPRAGRNGEEKPFPVEGKEIKKAKNTE